MKIQLLKKMIGLIIKKIEKQKASNQTLDTSAIFSPHKEIPTSYVSQTMSTIGSISHNYDTNVNKNNE